MTAGFATTADVRVDEILRAAVVEAVHLIRNHTPTKAVEHQLRQAHDKAAFLLGEAS